MRSPVRSNGYDELEEVVLPPPAVASSTKQEFVALPPSEPVGSVSTPVADRDGQHGASNGSYDKPSGRRWFRSAQSAADKHEKLLDDHPKSDQALEPPRSGPGPPSTASQHYAIRGWRRLYFVAMYCLTVAMLYADQNLMAPTMTAIAEDFGFDDKEKDLFLGAFISGAFFAVGAPAALIVGWVSDRVNRKWLLVCLVVLGEAPCLATLAVQEYWQLFLLRMLTGISLGGSLPLAFSMVGDLYGSTMRARVLSWVQIASGAGIAIGQAVAGYVDSVSPDDMKVCWSQLSQIAVLQPVREKDWLRAGPWLGWRAPFAIMAIPAIIITTLLALTTIDPPRGAADDGLGDEVDHGFVYDEHFNRHKLKTIFKTRSTLFSILQGLPGCLPWGIVLIYLNDFLAIPSDRNLGVHTATAIVLTNGVGGAVGVLGGGALGQYLYNRHKPWQATTIGSGVLLSVIPMYLLVNIPFHGGWAAFAFVFSFVVGVLTGAPGPNVRAIILDTNPPESRGMAIALQTVLDDLGRGLGPFLIGLLVQVMSRVAAFNIAIVGWIPCGLLIIAIRWYIIADVENMRRQLKAIMSKQGAPVDEAFQAPVAENGRCEGSNGHMTVEEPAETELSTSYPSPARDAQAVQVEVDSASCP